MATAVTKRQSPPSPTNSTELVETLTDAVNEATRVFSEDLTLTQKLINISSQLGNIPKNGTNREQGYKFVQETDIIRTLRPMLAQAGILITWRVVDAQTVIRPEGAGKSLLTQVQLDFDVTDGRETIQGTTFGYGMDTSDKGIYKAITGAKKYALMLLFLIDTGDDPEAHDGEEKTRGGGYAESSYGDEAWPPEADAKVPTVTQTERTDIVRGGNTTGATETQIQRLREACIANGVSTDMLRSVVAQLFSTEIYDMPKYLHDEISSRDIGKLILAVEAYGDRDPTLP